MADYNTEVRFSKLLRETFPDFAFEEHKQEIINWMKSIYIDNVNLQLELAKASKVTIRLYVGYSSSKRQFSYEAKIDVDQEFIWIPPHEFKLEEYGSLIDENIYDANDPDLLYSVLLDPDKPMSPYHITYPVTWSGTINNREVVLIQRDQPSSSDIHFDFLVYPNEFNSIRDDVVELIDDKLHRLLD